MIRAWIDNDKKDRGRAGGWIGKRRQASKEVRLPNIYTAFSPNIYIPLFSSHYIYAVLLTNIYIPLLNSHYIYAVLLSRIYIPFLNLFLILHPSSKLLPQHLFLPLTLTNTEILPLNLLYFYGIKSILNAASEKSLPPYLHYRGVANSVTVGLNDKS